MYIKQIKHREREIRLLRPSIQVILLCSCDILIEFGNQSMIAFRTNSLWGLRV